MQALHSFDFGNAMQIGRAVRVGLLTSAPQSQLQAGILSLGGQVEVNSDSAAFLNAMGLLRASGRSAVSHFDLIVVDCDSLGGPVSIKSEITALLAQSLPLILVSRAFDSHIFPEARGQAVQLRAPASSLSLRIGYEHALRDLARG
ncbi:hypothetical protein HOY34_05385 [Xinfangfangia sp. D13-10-4-6]|uniref:hypothetical protein n=1 Tax=Pseudogemmobacter hezensis TaxID=2737662 RepID=UPI0015556378|nr:hypothetical protein [Pseudogemmobacter hezensis]NPD14635.1 hypothetical protein [Pseudogemmobacter hezensis]